MTDLTGLSGTSQGTSEETGPECVQCAACKKAAAAWELITSVFCLPSAPDYNYDFPPGAVCLHAYRSTMQGSAASLCLSP